MMSDNNIDKKLTQIPIFVPLRSFAESGLSLFEFIVRQFKICNFPDAGPFIETILRKRGNFKLTPQVFARLKENNLPKKYLSKLKNLENKEFSTEEELFTNVQTFVDDNKIFEEYKALFLRYAKNEKWKTIILCDGLDEVPKKEDKRQKIIQELIDFSNEFEESQFVITCRIAASEYHFEGFTYVEIADFDEKQIASFIRNWFMNSSSLANNFLEEFGKIGNERLRDLARTPLILTLLCISYENTLELPIRRSEIYKEALDALLVRWSATRGIKRDEIYNHLSLGRKQQMFARIAAETFQKSQYLIKQEVLEEKIIKYLRNLPQVSMDEEINGTAILKAIESQHGIFVERAQGIYSFSHLTFQEYYAAKYIYEHLDKDMLNKAAGRQKSFASLPTIFLLP